MMRIYAILLSVLFIACNSVNARETKIQSLDEKVSRSDVILIGRVVSLGKPDANTVGVYGYAVVEIQNVIKGKDVPKNIKFITNGVYSEINPLCCVVGKQYIIFAQRGFDIFDDSGDEVVAVRKSIKEYHAAVNGPYSAYEVSGKSVIGWPDQLHKDSLINTKKVIREIGAAVRRESRVCKLNCVTAL